MLTLGVINYMEVLKEMKTIIRKDGFRRIVVALGLIGILLIFLSSFFKTNPTKKNTTEVECSTSNYIRQLENNLKNLVSSIKGAGEAKVLVTLESTEETVYATEEKTNKEATEDLLDGQMSKKRETDDTEKKYIKVRDSDGTERALSVTQIQPVVKGVVIVCEGGDDPQVQQRVTDAIKTALNITSKRVYVTK